MASPQRPRQLWQAGKRTAKKGWTRTDILPKPWQNKCAAAP
jgi:hypothetical protein